MRNIMVDIRAGISEKETFDPTPYASNLTTFLIAQKDSFTLPRKLKIAFDISEEEADYALINDLGFIPRIVDGKRGFKVYLGGSVASRPTKGWLLFDFVPEEDFFRIAIAVKRFFSENGNRKNRHKARIRHIFYKLGEAETLRIFRSYYEETKKDKTLDYTSSISPANYERPAFTPLPPDDLIAYTRWYNRYVTPQKQEGLFAVLLPFIHGNATPEVFRKLALFAGQFGEDVIRFTTRQHIQLRNLPEAWLAGAWQLFRKLGFDTTHPVLTNNIISRTGADTCRLGICFSKGAAKAIRNQLVKTEVPLDKLHVLKINISGCTNSCAQQIWADLGFAGRVSRNERMYPAYTVYGKTAGNKELGQALGVLSARDLPVFCEKLFRNYLEKEADYTSFTNYIQREGKGKIKELIDTFQPIPAFEEDKNYYYDWGAEEVFSVSERGKAECLAGLFDMIDIDNNILEKSRKELETVQDDKRRALLLADMVYSASRMLLITKGAEPRTTTESFDLFKNLFIEEGLVDKKYLSLVEAAKQKDPLLHREKEIFALADDVIALYGTMDDSLQFKTSTPQPSIPEEKSLEPLVKDFRGVSCPMNFVKTKLALATIPAGSLLEIWLDDGPPIENVPGSVRNEGHEIVSTTQVQDYWKVVIRK
ncbi:MAG: sulfurtransferase TusA family protein [Tannerellaceae bacterium]|nr:sulfurtransferase TusA family protein [Tannerellaceae bacterium]